MRLSISTTKIPTASLTRKAIPVKDYSERLLPGSLSKGNQEIPARYKARKHKYKKYIKNSTEQNRTSKPRMHLIMPPLTVPRTGSCHVLYKSCMSSCRWACAHTSPAYFVTSGQSWDATTYRSERETPTNFRLQKWYFFPLWRQLGTRNMGKCRDFTAAIEGLVSSPFSGWVTSAPNIMVGMSLTRGILQLIASRRTVFLPPICTKIKNQRNLNDESGQPVPNR